LNVDFDPFLYEVRTTKDTKGDEGRARS
jgi:hypothetical protein